MNAGRAFLLWAGMALSFAQPAGAEPAPIDVARSTLTIHVFKRGLLSMFADNHEIAAPIASGSYDAARKSVTLNVNAAQLQVLDPKLSPNRRSEVQTTMAGPDVLDVKTYPTIAFSSETIDETDAAHWTVTGSLTLHGQTHRITFPVRRADGTHFDGSATIRQTAFGMRPIRIAGGTVAVKDDVRVDFQIVLQ